MAQKKARNWVESTGTMQKPAEGRNELTASAAWKGTCYLDAVEWQ